MIQSQSLRVLGLPAGASEAEIRKAYAQKLRDTHPEDNPEGFKELRAAYEQALAQARYEAEYGKEGEPFDDDADGLPGVQDREPGRSEDRRRTEQVEPEGQWARPEPQDDVAPDRPLDPRRTEKPEGDERWTEAPPESPPLPKLSTEEQAHADACNKLAAALHANAPPEELHAALDGVLKSPALANVDTYNRTENWLIQALANTRPASHWLFDRAIAYFRWDQHVGDHRAWGPAVIVNMRARIPGERAAGEFLARVKDKRHEFHRAWKETTKPPRERNWLARAWSLRRYGLVERFLVYIDRKSPLAVEALDPEAVHWWRNRRRSGAGWVIGAVAFVQAFGLLGVVALGVLAFGLFAGDLPGGMPQVGPPLEQVAGGQAASTPPKAEGSKNLLAAISEVANKRAKELEALRPPAPEPRPGSRMVLTEFGKRVAARDECDNAAKRIRAGADAPRRAAAATARSMCLRELGKAPDSLMMMQYLAIAELADGNPAAAKDGFARILETSPNDPYALYGSGLAGVMLDPAGDTSLMAEALKREPAVKAYFTGFGFAPPDVAPMEGEPKSRFKKRRSPETDNEMKKLSTMDDDGVRGVLDHFGVRDSPDGVVTLECLIRADGSMTDCIVSKESPYNKGVAEFAIPVVEAVKFEPFTLKGAPVDNVPISYTLTLGDGDGKPKQAAAPAPAAPPAAAAPATPAAEPSPHTAPAN